MPTADFVDLLFSCFDVLLHRRVVKTKVLRYLRIRLAVSELARKAFPLTVRKALQPLSVPSEIDPTTPTTGNSRFAHPFDLLNEFFLFPIFSVELGHHRDFHRCPITLGRGPDEYGQGLLCGLS